MFPLRIHDLRWHAGGRAVLDGFSLELDGEGLSERARRYLTHVKEASAHAGVLVDAPEGALPIFVRAVEGKGFRALSTRCMHRGCQVEPAAAGAAVEHQHRLAAGRPGRGHEQAMPVGDVQEEGIGQGAGGR